VEQEAPRGETLDGGKRSRFQFYYQEKNCCFEANSGDVAMERREIIHITYTMRSHTMKMNISVHFSDNNHPHVNQMTPTVETRDLPVSLIHSLKLSPEAELSSI
jgi:hypothetical protein